MYLYHTWKNVDILATGCRRQEPKNKIKNVKAMQKYAPKFWLPSFKFFFPGLIYIHIYVWNPVELPFSYSYL